MGLSDKQASKKLTSEMSRQPLEDSHANLMT